MTKSALLALITGAGWTIETDSQKQTENTLVHWEIVARKTASDITNRQKFYYYMIGTDASWREEDPLATPSAFLQDVQDYIDGLITADTIEGAHLTSVNEEQETAIALFYIASGGNVDEDRVFIDYDSTPEIRHRDIN